MKPTDRDRRSGGHAASPRIPQPMPVIPRTPWNGMPQEEATWWSLHRNRQSAVCRMFSHPAGHELRLEISDDPFLSEVCRNDEDVLACQERWRAGLEGKGWR